MLHHVICHFCSIVGILRNNAGVTFLLVTVYAAHIQLSSHSVIYIFIKIVSLYSAIFVHRQVRLPVHGTILLQDTLPVAEFKIKKSGQRKYRDRRVFLFEQIVVISEVAERFTGHYYKHRMNIKVRILAS